MSSMEGDFSGERPRGPEHPGICDAAEFVDRDAIEAQAWGLIANRESLNDVEVAQQERRDNARTALWEGLTKSGHLSRIEIHGTFEEINAQVLSRLLRGWSDRLPEAEKRRRFPEICEELTIQAVQKAIVADELPESTAVALASDFPEDMPEKSARNLGYRPDNKKGMVRSTHLVAHPDGTYTRIIEQMSRSNGTWRSTFGFLKAAGITPMHRETADVTALATPFLYSVQDYTNGVVDIQKRLDQHAGPNIRYGEIIGANPLHVNYDQVRQESMAREKQAEKLLDGIAAYEEKLDALVAQGLIEQRQRDSQYGKKILHTLRAICTMAPEYAADCFGQKAATYYQRASDAVLTGDFDRAQRIISDARQHEEVVVICGASLSDEEEAELGLGLDSMANNLKNTKELWGWKAGICRVMSCATRPGQTEVGPCSVCRKCQAKFDKGQDPTKLTTRPKPKAPATIELIKPKIVEPEPMPLAA
ncbi:MAG TPA: hypothetical protein VK694_02500 [Verrucomicrobiae bacterium]|nr:hypothetical protein [Verrucomicrobiae bacterium]